MYSLTIVGDPVPKGRPRLGRDHAYTPERTRKWEEQVAWAWRAAGLPTLDGPLAVSMDFYRRTGQRCDLDNLAKAILDALNVVAWGDDAQIVEMHLRRYVDRQKPRVEIRVQQAE